MIKCSNVQVLIFSSFMQGVMYTGYLAFCAAVKNSIENGIDLTNPKFYNTLNEEELGKYLMGKNDVPCPMVSERLRVLKGMLINL